MIQKTTTAHRPSQSNMEYVTTKDGRKVKNTAYIPSQMPQKSLSVVGRPDTLINTTSAMTLRGNDDLYCSDLYAGYSEDLHGVQFFDCEFADTPFTGTLDEVMFKNCTFSMESPLPMTGDFSNVTVDTCAFASYEDELSFEGARFIASRIVNTDFVTDENAENTGLDIVSSTVDNALFSQDVTDVLTVDNSSLSQCTFQGGDIAHVSATGSTFTDCTFDGMNFGYFNSDVSQIHGCTFTGCSFVNSVDEDGNEIMTLDNIIDELIDAGNTVVMSPVDNVTVDSE